MNCELSEPSTVMSLGCNGPVTLKGSVSLFDLMVTPSSGSMLKYSVMGRLSKLPEPVIVTALSVQAAMGMNNLADNPLSPQLISVVGCTPVLIISSMPFSV